MYLLSELLIWVYVTLNPKYWIRNYRYEKHWDKKVRELIKSNAPVKIRNDCVADIGGNIIWIANYPYAFGHPEEPLEIEVLPSRRTVYRLNKYIWEKHWNTK